MNADDHRMQLRLNGSLNGTEIVNLDGEDLGKLEEIMVHVDRQRPENAPGFDEDAWPTTADPGWMSDVYRHDGATYRPHATDRRDSSEAPFAPLRKS